MKDSIEQRSRGQRAAERSGLELWSLTATAGAVALLLLAGEDAHAQAQDTNASDAPQTVVVTGIRRGIEGAISAKKNADAIVEAVTAEDIGKLPDTSIAESIARLPGLSAQRVAGRAQVISVRGLSPDFATTLLNGRELVSTGDNRSVEFDQYPSELLSSVIVYKTPDAGLVGQGLSGTLDMQTIRPLNMGSRVISLNGRFERNSLGAIANAKATGNRFSASYIDQFADRTVGLLVGFAHLETPVLEQQVGLYEPWKTDARPGLPAGTWASDGIKSLARSGVNKRDGLMATVEWRPSKTWTSALDLYYSKFKKEDTANQFEVNLSGYNGLPDTAPDNQKFNYTNPVVNGNGTLVSGDANNTYPLVRGMYNNREDTIKAVGLNNKFTVGDVRLVVDGSWSKAVRDETNLENNTQLLPFPQLDTVRLNYNTGGFPTVSPGLDYSDASKLFLRGTIYGSGYGKVPHVDDELKALKVAGSFGLPSAVSGVLPELEVGVNYADRAKHKRQPEGGINVGAQGEVPLPSDLLYSPVDLGFSGIGVIPSWNVPAVVARYMTFDPNESASYLISKAWNVSEKITTAFAKASVDTQLGGIPVRGNVGVQVQHVDQASNSRYWDGTAPAGSEIKPINDGKTYTDVLPSLNLAFELGNDQMLRMALARQVARPRVDQLRSSLDFGVDTATGRPGASGGNPQLDPWRANALDISYEKYFGTKAYVSAAAFYKDLRTYIYTQSRDYDFSQFVAGYTPPNTCTVNGQPNQPCPAPQTTGTFTAPYNGNGGKLKGVELTASLPLRMLTPALSGFGIVASASFNSSNIKIKDPDSATSVGSGDIDLPGLSKRVYNLTAYYENAGFEVRVSQRRRSDFIGEIGNFAGNRTLRYVEGENITDAQIGYTFQDGSLKGLGLLLQANNLTNAAYKTYAGTKDRPLEYIKWGRSYLLGANYSF
jgi:iron complex outermembrane receptor protein